MKNLPFVCALAFALVFAGVSCTKSTVSDTSDTFPTPYTERQVSEIVHELSSDDRDGDWWQEVKKWFKDHAGIYMPWDCDYVLPCGDCPGICILGEMDGVEVPSAALEFGDYEIGLRTFGMVLVMNVAGDEEILLVFKDNVEDLVNQGYFYFLTNVNANVDMCNSMSRNSIEFHRGKYLVVQDPETGLHYCLVSTTIH
jgi:hypothetical protein